MRILHLRFYLLPAFSALLLSACGAGQANVADPQVADSLAALPVEVVVPRTTDIYETFDTTATIASDAEAPVLARVPGQVVEILVEEGDRVKKGQVLARLDGERLALQLRQAKASLDMTSREYERFSRLRDRGLVSAAAVENLKFDLDALTASYELIRLNHGYTQIRAPIAGVISSRDVKHGTHIEAGTTAFRITETTRLVAYLHIPQIELSRISTGDDVTVQVDALPGHEFIAKLSRISPTIDVRNGTFRATVYLDNDAGQLAPGMFSRFSIACDKHDDAMVVPSNAVVQEDGEYVVYVVNDGAALRKTVTVGIESGGITEILAGLDSGDRVVVTGQGSLRDGSKVLASKTPGESSSG